LEARGGGIAGCRDRQGPYQRERERERAGLCGEEGTGVVREGGR